VRENTRQTNKIVIYSQTVDLDVAGSNPVTHPIFNDLAHLASHSGSQIADLDVAGSNYVTSPCFQLISLFWLQSYSQLGNNCQK